MTRTVQPLLQVGLSDLVDETRNGNPDARNALAERCLPEIEQYARNRRSVDPVGLANTVVGNFIAKVDRLHFDADNKVWAYLYRSAQTGLVDQHRRRAERSLASAPIDFDQLPVDGFEQSVDDKVYIEDLLEHLTEDQSEVLQLRFIEDLTLEQTAQRTGRTITAVKALQSRALRAAVRAAAAMAVIVLSAAGLIRYAVDDDQGVSVRPPATPSVPPLIDDPRLLDDDGVGPQTTIEPTPIEPQRASSIPRSATTVSDPPAAPAAPDGALSTSETDGVEAEPPAAPTGEPDAGQTGAPPTAETTATTSPAATTTLAPTTSAPTSTSQPITGAPSSSQSTTPEVPSGSDGGTGGGPGGGPTTTLSATTVFSCGGISGTWITLESLGYRVTIGTDDADVIVLDGAFNDFVVGFGGDDEIRTGEGNDVVCAGGGADSIYGGPGNDMIDGQHGNDLLNGGRGDDTLHGGDGNDVFTDTVGTNEIVGGNGADTANDRPVE